MRWLPGTRILTWVDDTGARSRGYQRSVAAAARSGGRDCARITPAASQAAPAEDVQVEMGHANSRSSRRR